MTNLHSLEDEATLYVLGRMTETERVEFEACLTESTELRALVRELEEGAVAIAMASPQRRAPQRVWAGIEKAIAEETKPRVMKSSFWIAWLRSGWAATAACLIGWLLYTIWMDGSSSPTMASNPNASEIHEQRGEGISDSLRVETKVAKSPSQISSNTDRGALLTNLQATTRENGALRFQKAQLEKELTHLSQVVTQQQVLLSESSRLKVLQLGPASAGGLGATNAIPSPELQRALLLAMARELGWLQPDEHEKSGSTLTNQTGVEFVDLHPNTNETKAPFSQQMQMTQELIDSENSASPSSFGGSEIPVLVMDDKTMIAFDPSDGVVPTGSEVGFWTGNAEEGFHLVGSTTMGSSTTVVGFQPTSAGSGGTLTVTSQGPSGSFSVIGQVPLPATLVPLEQQNTVP